jgi:NAD(P) transhydrogenase subunit beta
MSLDDARNLVYLLAGALFVTGLVWMRHPASARRGNLVAAAGMVAAVVGTFLSDLLGGAFIITLGVAIGTLAGVPAARGVKMTAMPQMVAAFNGVGGGAVAVIAWAEIADGGGSGTDVLLPLALGALIGSVSFAGSMVAFAKLQGLIGGQPITFLGVRVIAFLLACGAVVLATLTAAGIGDQSSVIGLIALAGTAGALLVLPIGGADMPVVISLLNACTGLSAAASGLALDNLILIVAGMIVGASGTILTREMAHAMNRSIVSVLAGGMGGDGGDGGVSTSAGGGVIRSSSPADVAIQCVYAGRVLIVPGYGMAVAQAQHAVCGLGKALAERGVEVAYGIHPVAGRMPGHMNVLLAEAEVDYEQMLDDQQANAEMGRTDVVLVIGANDVVNPAALDDPGSPLYGMPIINVSQATSVVVLKRSMAAGYAGVANPLFGAPNAQMLFGDAKGSVSAVIEALRKF